MTIDYKLDEDDLLIHQLFFASKSDRIKKKRQRSKVMVPIFYAAIGLLFFFLNNLSLSIIFIVVGILWFFIYPIWERRHYIKHYQDFIKENYKDRIGRTVTIEFNNDFILAKDNGSESKFSTSEIEEISEIPTTIFVCLKGGQSFLLPKDKLNNIHNVTTQLKELATNLKIKYVIDEQWKWK